VVQQLIFFFMIVLPFVAVPLVMGAGLRHRGYDEDATAEDPVARRASIPILPHASRELQGDETALDGSCHLFVETDPTAPASAAKGILFAIKSDDADLDGVMVSDGGIQLFSLWIRLVMCFLQPTFIFIRSPLSVSI
jgi:hypothetical protein